MKKVFVISNYFVPEIGAAASRINNLANSLGKKKYEVSVICPLPNYPNGVIRQAYKGKIYSRTYHGGIEVHRLWIYPSNSKNKVKRIVSMLSFSVSLAFFMFCKIFRPPDLIIINSPPLFVSFTGVFFSKFFRGTKIVLNVSDLWPESAVELGVLKKNSTFHHLLKRMEKFIYKNANAIVGQSREILGHIKTFSDAPLFLYRNLPKTSFKRDEPEMKPNTSPRTIVYAGLLGFAQGILQICENIDFHELGCEFHIYGRGMQQEDIKNYISRTGKPIYFHGEFSKEEAYSVLSRYDAGLVPLATHIKGAFPSKIYELIQLEMPILYPGEGDGAELISQENIGLVSEPGNWKSMSSMLQIFSGMNHF